MGRVSIIACCALLAACHSSRTIDGDAFSHPDADVWGLDTWDATDPGPDVGPPDFVPDVGPDLPMGCEPAAGAYSWFEVDGTAWPFDEISIDAECILEMATEEDEAWLLVLGCPSPDGTIERHEVRLGSDPFVWPAVYPGMPVRFVYIADPIWWVNRYLKIGHPHGGFALIAVEAQTVVPHGMSEEEWWEGTCEVSILSGLCPLEPEGCGDLERQALGVTFLDFWDAVFDGNAAVLGVMNSLDVVVGTAQRYVDMDCDDIPDPWYSAMFVPVPEG